MKALEKDRTRRYETANAFAADVRRYLDGEAVQAHPPGAGYRLRKFVRRNRGRVVAAALVLLALVAGVVGTSIGLVRATRATLRESERAEGERTAKQEALKSAEEERKAKEMVEAVLGFVEDRIFAAARPKDQEGGLGYDVKLADAVTAALPFIEKGFPDQPLTEARLRMTIGQSFLYLGKPEIAAGQFEAARSLVSRHLGPDHPYTLKSTHNLADSYVHLGRHAEALKLGEVTLALMKAKLGPDHPDTLISMNNLAESCLAADRTSEALPLWETCSSAKPEDTLLILKVAALQAWYGKDREFAATRRRVLALAEGTNDVSLAERAAKVSSILPSSERAELEAALALGRKAVELGKVAGGISSRGTCSRWGWPRTASAMIRPAMVPPARRGGRPRQPPCEGHLGVLSRHEPAPAGQARRGPQARDQGRRGDEAAPRRRAEPAR